MQISRIKFTLGVEGVHQSFSRFELQPQIYGWLRSGLRGRHHFERCIVRNARKANRVPQINYLVVKSEKLDDSLFYNQFMKRWLNFENCDQDFIQKCNENLR